MWPTIWARFETKLLSILYVCSPTSFPDGINCPEGTIFCISSNTCEENCQSREVRKTCFETYWWDLLKCRKSRLKDNIMRMFARTLISSMKKRKQFICYMIHLFITCPKTRDISNIHSLMKPIDRRLWFENAWFFSRIIIDCLCKTLRTSLCSRSQPTDTHRNPWASFIKADSC